MAFEQQVDGIIPDAAWGTFTAYLANFITSFKDPNDSRTAQNELAVLGKDSQWKNSSRSLINLHNVLDTAPMTNFALNS